MDINNFLKQKTFKLAVLSIGALILLLLVFKAGVFVGYKKASFSYAWGENYHRNFAGPRGGFMGNMKDLGRGDFIEGHGAFGQIIKIDARSIVVRGRDNTERVVLVKEDTKIERF